MFPDAPATRVEHRLDGLDCHVERLDASPADPHHDADVFAADERADRAPDAVVAVVDEFAAAHLALPRHQFDHGVAGRVLVDRPSGVHRDDGEAHRAVSGARGVRFVRLVAAVGVVAFVRDRFGLGGVLLVLAGGRPASRFARLDVDDARASPAGKVRGRPMGEPSAFFTRQSSPAV